MHTHTHKEAMILHLFVYICTPIISDSWTLLQLCSSNSGEVVVRSPERRVVVVRQDGAVRENVLPQCAPSSNHFRFVHHCEVVPGCVESYCTQHQHDSREPTGLTGFKPVQLQPVGLDSIWNPPTFWEDRKVRAAFAHSSNLMQSAWGDQSITLAVGGVSSRFS